MPPARSPLHPLAAALLLAIGDAGASGFIPVNIGGDAHVPGRCTLREAIAAANTHATPAGTDCVAGSGGGNTIAIPPSLSPIELSGVVLDIADSGGETRIQSAVSGTRVAVRRVSGSGRSATMSRFRPTRCAAIRSCGRSPTTAARHGRTHFPKAPARSMRAGRSSTSTTTSAAKAIRA